jgi:hypothetical protein
MRKDQLERLSALSEKLADVVLSEADPDGWPGHGISPPEWTQQQRGDRYWCKKNAAATFVLLAKSEEILSRRKAGDSDDEPELDATIARAEKEAAKAIQRMQDASGKAKFDKRVHGGKA